ncbi:MAG: hypothetical protein WBO08_02390 [Mycobacterium sp.]
MRKFCGTGARVHTDSRSARAVADYLAGYGEALADRCAERQPDRVADE